MTEPRVQARQGRGAHREGAAARRRICCTRRGAEGVSLRDVADQVGISVGNLQYYFPTRAALLDAVFDRHAEIFRDELAALSANDRRPARAARGARRLLARRRSTTRTQSLFWYLSAISPHDDRAREIMDRVYGDAAHEDGGVAAADAPGVVARRRAASRRGDREHHRGLGLVRRLRPHARSAT